MKKVNFYIPAFHINAHKQSCVDEYHPRNVCSLGDIDGEAVERIWSQLSVFSHTTRNMSAANRREALEDAVTDLQSKVKASLIKNLQKKLKETKKTLLVLAEKEEFQSEVAFNPFYDSWTLNSITVCPKRDINENGVTTPLEPLDIVLCELKFCESLLKSTKIAG